MKPMIFVILILISVNVFANSSAFSGMMLFNSINNSSDSGGSGSPRKLTRDDKIYYAFRGECDFRASKKECVQYIKQKYPNHKISKRLVDDAFGVGTLIGAFIILFFTFGVIGYVIINTKGE
ncbi:hypothetical protein [uncultured Arcobacter sp.]|uniref:hypothetical protein n=1 Tax=uncultured Arcobacter sp. TaxID=165434 RepID=UPI00262E3C04|nr:hypothetical protein [uncultured Arcobacter sp.]